MKKFFLILFVFVSFISLAQESYWQQYVQYYMDIDMNVENHTYKGFQKVEYQNNSPDTLYDMYYHLYWNVFKPGSSLYWHNKTRKDPDKRIEKLKNLKPDEIGDYKIFKLTQNGKEVSFEITESVLRVKLNEPVAPGEKHVFEMEYAVQIPKIIRRSGRDSAEGIDYSMAQWYPKIAEYRPDGWHADPFLGREFFGIWGDFDVTIHIDKNYVIGGSGYLQNADEIWKKDSQGNWTLKKAKGKKRTWIFKAPDVHDFSWAADPDYVRKSIEHEGVELNFYYQPKGNEEKWEKLKNYTARTLTFFNNLMGPYPYKQYSVIQAGDGGMEYAMCTFITANRTERSLVGVTIHELAHSWFQFVLATDETRHHWLDEGFTTFVSNLAMALIYEKQQNIVNPWIDMLDTYLMYENKKETEPISLHSDFFQSHLSYWVNAYDKGGLFLMHLINVAGMERMIAFLKNYYAQWKFKHPEPEDMLRVAEKSTGMELDWLYNHWIESTHVVDYGIKSVTEIPNGTKITIEKLGTMPNAIEVLVVLKDGDHQLYHIPYFRTLQYKEKHDFVDSDKYFLLKPWYDGFPEYTFEIPVSQSEVERIVLDPWHFSADVNKKNHEWPAKDKEGKK